MAGNPIREIRRFYCEDDDGNEYVVIELQHFTVFESVKGERRELPGLLMYRLSDGRDVNWKSEDTFEIVATEVLIRKV